LREVMGAIQVIQKEFHCRLVPGIALEVAVGCCESRCLPRT
jgi:hypothetical protein